MPFRIGNGAKELAMFTEFAKTRQRAAKKQKKDGRGSKQVKIEDLPLPVYFPGFVLFTVPGQPWWLFDIDAAFWGNALYVAGSVLYIAQALYYWHELSLTPYDDYNPNNPSNYLNLIAAALFVANAIVCQLDWWLTKTQHSVMNVNIEHVDDELSAERGVLHMDDISNRILNLYFWNNNFFFAAALTFLIWGCWLYDDTTDTVGCHSSFCWSFTMPFLASTFYVISALCALWEFFETSRFRQKSNLPPLTLFNWDFFSIDWFGWGDLLYIIAAILPFCQAFLTGFGDTTMASNLTVAPLYFTSNFVFLVDSICYQIGYQLFIRDIQTVMRRRRDEELWERKQGGFYDSESESESESESDFGGGGGRESVKARRPSERQHRQIKSSVTKMMLRRDPDTQRGSRSMEMPSMAQPAQNPMHGIRRSQAYP